MRPILMLSALACAVALPLSVPAAHAAETQAWPPKFTFDGGTEFTLTGNVAWDFVRFDDDDRLEDADGLRRREFGATLRKRGVYDAMVYYDFEAGSWLDAFVRFESEHFFGRDLGRLRIGYMKVPVGFEGVTSSRAVSFLELSAPIQAIYQGRRTGVEWTLEQDQALFQVGGYAGQDLEGGNPGQTVALRGAWTPRKAEGDVLHLGVTASRENPEGTTGDDGEHIRPGGRLRARPGSNLTDLRLVDSGELTPVSNIVRTGLEGLWIRGPVSLQGELLRAEVERDDGLGDYTADGGYIAASWLVTGETRPYSQGNVANPVPNRPTTGAVELLARYSTLDLDSGGIAGGRQHDWTFGANWYLSRNVKLQANYVRVNATRGEESTSPSMIQMRAQVHF
ncbi:OprO/OprP family phosphate-selective porin [Luteimonas abyssi]|uniref:OprO/OprP family phosphate-selective porin n=1 Tax=Luteimonas abyssi TaxID=1247514 RepID=UPI000737B87E|nr:porin [Luteimonas abyssi]